MSGLIPTYFENESTLVRFNYIMDALRGCWDEHHEFVPFSDLSDKDKEIYSDEAKVADYIISDMDLDNIEAYLASRMKRI